jgi:ribosomal-protein-alanine N-acetyltransferase
MERAPGSAATALDPFRWWHIPAVLELEHDLFGDEAWTAELFWSELANPHAYYLVAHAAGDAELAGYGGLAVTGADAYIQTIGVSRRAQRRGIGRQLMHVLLDEAARRRATVCWLEVRADNAPAQQLYAALGFVSRGVRRGYYQPSGMDALVMSGPVGSALPTRGAR